MKIKIVEGNKNYKTWRKYAIIFMFLFAISGFLLATGRDNPLNPKPENPYEICELLKGTPAWVEDEKILGYGYKENWNTIPEGVSFYYRSDCGWCHKQILVFGEEYFNKLTSEGRAFDCS